MSNITYFSNNNDLTSDESVQSTCSGIYSQIGHEENWQNSSEAITRTSNSSKAKGSNHLENSISQTEDLNQFYHHLINTESVNLPRYGYMKFQPEINNQMRKNLVDWMIELHLNLELAPETLYLAVNLIDRYLEKVKIKKDKVELVCITAMHIACKYEEVEDPPIQDYVDITEGCYSREEIINMERIMLIILGFNITVISPYNFIQIFAKLSGESEEMFYLCQYMLELALLKYKMILYKPSVLASGALYLSHIILMKTEDWPLKVQQYTCLEDEEVISCAKDMYISIQKAGSSSFQAVVEKFSLPEFGEVAKIQIDTNLGALLQNFESNLNVSF
ncbi:unnamed protein product [Moneuplotes crassus]|uniref:Cyclin N-terminal domain-containing protein n=1 Tax=Euplotes crassus TaxID=5936 RepID=A0AAD1XMI6_EUPCR|nr:unnamed protein product [Moneuplotes crassus]